MTHHQMTIVTSRFSIPADAGLIAVECDCGSGIFWVHRDQDVEEVTLEHLASGDTREFVKDEPASITLDEAMELLAVLYYDMHPVYGSSSRRGRGIGGQSMTQQCNVVDPEGWEVAFNDRVEEALHTYASHNGHMKPQTVRVMNALKRKARADAVTVAETDLRLDVISNASPYPFTKSTLMVTHIPTGIQARRELHEYSGHPQVTQRQARLECIEEIVDKLKGRILDGQ
jgi:hypothetical protein